MNLATQLQTGIYQFHTEASTKGTGKEIRTAFPPDLHRAVKILATKIPQYETLADVVRDCTFHWVKEWTEVLKDDPEVYGMIFRAMETQRLENRREMQRRWREMLTEGERSIIDSLRMQDYECAANELVQLERLTTVPAESIVKEAKSLIEQYLRLIPQDDLYEAKRAAIERERILPESERELDFGIGSDD